MKTLVRFGTIAALSLMMGPSALGKTQSGNFEIVRAALVAVDRRSSESFAIS